MKTVNKLIIILVALVALKANALNTFISKEELVNKMAESKNVNLFLEQRIQALVSTYNEQLSNIESDKKIFSDQAKKTLSESQETKKLIELEFPELAVMNEKEKSDTYELLLKTPAIAEMVRSVAGCIGRACLAGVICEFGSLGFWQLAVFGACLSAAIIVDIALFLAGPVGAAIVANALAPEATSCWAVATASTLSAGAAITVNCLTGTVGIIGVCIAR